MTAAAHTAFEVVFPLFIAAMLVLAVLVVRFARRQGRRTGSDEPAPPALEDDPDHR